MMSLGPPSTTCLLTSVRINRFSEVLYETNRYSVPSRLAYRDAIIEAFDDRIAVSVDSVLVAEHERALGKRKAILDLVHFIDRLSFLKYGLVHAEVLRRRRFCHSLQSLLNGYVERNSATASKCFAQVVALLEHHTMQQVYNAIELCAQNGSDDPKMIALILKQASGPCDDPLTVVDPEEWRTDRRNLSR
jgi:hypothetical protein